MLSSDQPGEVFAAAQAIGRALPECGLDWHQFAKLVAGRLTSVPGKAKAEVHDKNNDAYRASEERYRKEHEELNTISVSEIAKVAYLMRHLGALREREQEFISSIHDRVATYGNRSFMSAKQRAWLTQIWEEHGE